MYVIIVSMNNKPYISYHCRSKTTAILEYSRQIDFIKDRFVKTRKPDISLDGHFTMGNMSVVVIPSIRSCK